MITLHIPICTIVLCEVDIKNVKVNDGKGHEVKPPSNVETKKHFTLFDDK